MVPARESRALSTYFHSKSVVYLVVHIVSRLSPLDRFQSSTNQVNSTMTFDHVSLFTTTLSSAIKYRKI